MDEEQEAAFTNIDNDSRRMESVQWGAVSGIDSGTRGSYYFDAFESRRETYIGEEEGALPPPELGDLIFADGYESGNFSAWSLNTNDSGDLSVTAGAALKETRGMAALLDDNNSIYVTDYQPSEETHYRARFYFDPNAITMTNGNAHFLLYAYNQAGTLVARVEFRRNSGTYQVRAGAVNDASTWSNSAWVTISDASHALEIEWQAATAAGANNGVLTLWVDGNQQGSFTNIDNDTRLVDYVQLGAVAGVDSGTRGTEYFDAFESRREDYIGLAMLLNQPDFVQAESKGGKAGLARPTPIFMQPEVRIDTSLITVSYAYDSLYRLTAANYSDGNFFHYTYDAVGNRLTETTRFGTNTYVYDAANRLVSVNAVNYTWDNNGNLLSDGEYTYTYDHANRLKTMTDGVNTRSYSYNGLGDRVSETVNEVTTDYVLDLAGGLTQVLAEGTNSYLYGNARIMQENSSAEKEYFLGDALGSVRMLADEEGEITLLRSYEPYGEVLSSQGSGETSYAFTGEQYDPQTGLVYLRARYYSTTSGRFMSRDAWAGDKGMPMSYNAWLYGYGNPVIYTDPNGLCSVRDEDCLQVSRTLKISYGWEIIGTWQLNEVNLFLESAKLISSFFDKTGGNGAGRMRAFAPVYLEHANNFWTTGGYHHVFMRRIILTPIISIGNVTHEFSHIIDNVLGISLFSSISGGGPSDEFAKHLGVDLSACPKRFACANYKKLLEDARAEEPYVEYALNGPSEDFAVTFEQLVLGNSSFKNENPIRAAWMMQFIESNKQSRDLIFEPAPAPEPANDIASICDSDEYMKTPTP